MDFHDLREKLLTETEPFEVIRNGESKFFNMPSEIVSCLEYLLSEHEPAQCKFFTISKEDIEWWDTKRRRTALLANIEDYESFIGKFVLVSKEKNPQSILKAGPEHEWASMGAYAYPEEKSRLSSFFLENCLSAIANGSMFRIYKGGTSLYLDFTLQEIVGDTRNCHNKVKALSEKEEVIQVETNDQIIEEETD